MSSFVLQLVPSRVTALQEVRRVLRPGAPVAWAAWLRSDRPYAPDRVANEVLDDAGFDPPEPDPHPSDFASVEAAAATTRRAGFRKVRASEGEAVHVWTPEGYLRFLTDFDEQSLFDDLEPDERREIENEILARLRELDAEQLTLRLPVVYVLAVAP
jgi:hypothetical protein